jgi:hypothetical protein
MNRFVPASPPTLGVANPDVVAEISIPKLLQNSAKASAPQQVLSEKPNTAFAKHGWAGEGEALLGHRAHPLSVLRSGKPGACVDAPGFAS